MSALHKQHRLEYQAMLHYQQGGEAMLIRVPCRICKAEVEISVQYVPDKANPGPIVVVCSTCKEGHVDTRGNKGKKVQGL